MNKETKIQRDIQKYLNNRKIFNWRNSDSKTSGMPDLMACYKGYLVALEVKTPEGRPTEIQVKTLEAIRNAGGLGELVKSIEDVETILTIIDIEDAWRR